jgi:hypothetical protein
VLYSVFIYFGRIPQIFQLLVVNTTKYVENHIAKDGTCYKIVGCNEGLNANKSATLDKII